MVNECLGRGTQTQTPTPTPTQQKSSGGVVVATRMLLPNACQDTAWATHTKHTNQTQQQRQHPTNQRRLWNHGGREVWQQYHAANKQYSHVEQQHYQGRWGAHIGGCRRRAVSREELKRIGSFGGKGGTGEKRRRVVGTASGRQQGQVGGWSSATRSHAMHVTPRTTEITQASGNLHNNKNYKLHTR